MTTSASTSAWVGRGSGWRRRSAPSSEVENGKGFLLTLAPDLTRQAVLELPMPRDVQVRAVRLLPDGDLLLAGIRNGPLTHTEPAMTGNDGFWGVASLGH